MLIHCKHFKHKTWGRLNIKMSYKGIPTLKIRRSRDRLVFNMGIPYLRKTVFILRRGPDDLMHCHEDVDSGPMIGLWWYRAGLQTNIFLICGTYTQYALYCLLDLAIMTALVNLEMFVIKTIIYENGDNSSGYFCEKQRIGIWNRIIHNVGQHMRWTLSGQTPSTLTLGTNAIYRRPVKY